MCDPWLGKFGKHSIEQDTDEYEYPEKLCESEKEGYRRKRRVSGM